MTAVPSPDRAGGGGPRSRRRSVLALKGVAILFAVTGVLVLADGVLTLVWQEPISGLRAHFAQARLAQSLKTLEGRRATPADERALAGLPTDSQRMAFFARGLRQSARAGQAVGRIRIPRIGASFVVVAGTDEPSLQKGPGIYAGTAVPGLRGTVGIAGHRTTYLAPFRRIDELARGDRITLEMPYGLFSYTVLRHEIVSPSDVGVLRRAPYDQVVLTACNPLYSAAQRIAVFARLSAVAPAGPALSSQGASSAPLLPAAGAVQAILGDALPADLGPAPAPPRIDAGQVVLGAGAGAPLPGARATAARRPRAGRRHGLGAQPRHVPARAPVRGSSSRPAPRRQASPRPRVRPILRPPPLRAAPRRPVRVAPRAPARVIVHQPSVRRPSAPSRPRPPAGRSRPAPQTQTRVQGSPGGPAPIIG